MIMLAHSPDVSCLFNLDHQCPSPSSVPPGSLPPASEHQPRSTHFVFLSQQHPTSSAGFYISQRPYRLGPPLYTPKPSDSFPKHSLLPLALSPACWEASPTVRAGHLEHTGFEDPEARGEMGRDSLPQLWATLSLPLTVCWPHRSQGSTFSAIASAE